MARLAPFADAAGRVLKPVPVATTEAA